jgi:hypothetical protein
MLRYQGDCVPGDVVRAAAVDGALRVDRRIALPLWLLALFTVSFNSHAQAAPAAIVSSLMPCLSLDLVEALT